MLNLKPLTGYNALVCGASRGIGRATAQILAEQGARVVLLARNQSALAQIADTLAPTQNSNQPHCVLACDLNHIHEVRKKIRALREKENLKIHILVNNTSGPKAGPIYKPQNAQHAQNQECVASHSHDDIPNETELLHAFSAHIIAAQGIAAEVVEGMKTDGFGRIINVLSTSVRAPIAGLGVSNTIRAAMAGWAKTLSNELAPFGITVNNVLPGYTATERLTELLQAKASQENSTAQEIEKQWRISVPMGRFAKPEEIATAVSFFASPLAGYITGQSLAVDGGRTPSI